MTQDQIRISAEKYTTQFSGWFESGETAFLSDTRYDAFMAGAETLVNENAKLRAALQLIAQPTNYLGYLTTKKCQFIASEALK